MIDDHASVGFSTRRARERMTHFRQLDTSATDQLGALRSIDRETVPPGSPAKRTQLIVIFLGSSTHSTACGVRSCMAHKKLYVPPSFEAIMQRHEREIMRYLLRVLRDPEDAADLFKRPGYARTAPILDLSPKATLGRGCMRSRTIYVAIGHVTVRAARA